MYIRARILTLVCVRVFADMICLEVSQRVSDPSITCPSGRGDPSRHVVSNGGKIITGILSLKGAPPARAHAHVQTQSVHITCT